MKITIRKDTIQPMLEFCRKFKAGHFDRSCLEDLLNHEDYQVEFTRYQQDISKSAFIDYFENIFETTVEEIENMRFKIHYEHFMEFINQIDQWEANYQYLFDHITEEWINEGIQYALKGLPDEINFDKVQLLFTVSIGNSFGWPYIQENLIHFDFMKFFDFLNIRTQKGIIKFKTLIGHEFHHIGIQRLYDKIETKSVLEDFLLFMSFEGLAIKFCNNFEGILNKKIYESLPANIGMDKSTFAFYRQDFPNMLPIFLDHLIQLEKSDADEDKLMELINYWRDPYQPDEDRSQAPKLLQSPNYYMGSEIYGMIYDLIGKENLYGAIKHPETITPLIRECLKAKKENR